MLPWTLSDPSVERRQSSFDCRTCPDRTLEGVRQDMHCGWMPEERWTPGPAALPPGFGPDPYTLDVCPGWLVQQAAVIEGAQAYAACKNGTLARFDPVGYHRITVMVDIAQRAFGLYEQERQEEIRRRMERR